MQSKSFYVYVYLDPRKVGKYQYGQYKFDYEPFYIGKGMGNRFKRHLFECDLKKCTNKLKVNKINKIIKESSSFPIIVKYKENLIEKDALDLEINMIKIIGKIINKTGPLANITDGGEGISGLGYLRTGKNNPFFGKTHTNKYKKLISKLHSNKLVSDETKEKLRACNLGRKQSKKEINNRNKSLKEFWKSKKGKIKKKIISKKYKGSKNPFFGRKHSLKTILKIKKSLQLKKEFNNDKQ